ARKDSSSYGIVSARMAKSILDETDQDDGTNESTKYLRKKAAEILEKGIKNSPKNSEGAMICQSYLDNMKLPEFSFHSLDAIPPNEPTLIQATYRNQDDIYLWVFKVDRDLQESSEFYNSKDRVIQKIMTGTKPIIQRKQKLFNDGLFHKHTSHIVIDPLPVGHYVIITANNDDPKKISEKETQLFYSFVTVTSMAVIERQIEGYHERGLYIVDRTTGQPIENVEVTARYSYRGKNDIFIAKKKTDKTGYVHFNWLNPKAQDKPANSPDENTANATLLDKVKKIFTGGSNGSKDNKNTDKVETEINEYGTYFELRYGDENIIVGKNIIRHYFSSYNTIYRKDYRTEFLLDRAIYRPGQRVYFKCIVYDNDEKHIIADKDVDISVVDPNNQKFFTMTKKLNEFGSVDGEFDIPTDRLNGSFTILCDTYGGDKSFTVEEYKRPKFRVTFKPQNVGYQLNKEVKVVGVAKSYAGIPITDAVVGYNVNRSMQIPWWFRGFVDSSQVTVASGQTKTDEHGEFEIKFIAKANVTAAEIACIFNVSANVTDINGETQSDQTSVSIGGLPFDIRMYIPEIVPKGEKKQLTIGVTYRDGQKHTNKGTIVVSKLKSPQTYCVEKPFGNNTAELIREDEFHKLFPHYAYNGENNYENWPVEKKCFTVNYDTAVSDKIDLSRLDGEPIGVYAASLETRDDKGKLIAIKQYFTLTDKSAVLPTPQLSYFQCDKYSAIPGQSVTFDIGSSEPINVFVEKERQSKILEASWHQFSGRKQFSFDINREDCGNVTYHFTFIRNNQSFTFDRTIRVEYNHKELDIQVKTIRDVMQPGEKGTIELTVKDFMGKPIAAELAAVLYDASLNRFASNQWHFNPYR
ncbi:MAG: hypothetical protein IKP67_07545, partial [Spirochaetales bacterium]|nr:hypothetical protein [Spirochaetales bacterium]